ncbi:hypothetical protein GBAR_LOCUS8571, partial [Geodia barretti]
MRQLHYTLAVILASLLPASSVAASSCPNFTKELLEDLLSNEARKITIANDETLCDNDQQLTSDAERAATVIIEYSCSGEDCVVTGHDYALVDIRCIDGIWNEESFAPRQSDLYGLVSTGGIIPNSCADCIDMTTLMNRDYPRNPPGNLDYNETTHCLELPMCHGSDESFLGYFSARECCVDIEEGSSYTYGENFTCIVHGFEKTQYTVLEGDTVDVIFKRNVKSVTAFPLLTIEGSIVTEDINVDDFIPVSVTLLRREESKTISVTARDDDVALEGGDKIILRHTSGINNYVDAVEQRGEFIRYTTEVIIIDKNELLLINVEKSYTVLENNITERNLTVTWQENLSNQKPIILKLTGRSLDVSGVNQDNIARPGQDFVEDTVDFVIPENRVGQYDISLFDFIINDGTVEHTIQSFDLEIKAATEGVVFDSENSTETVTEVAIECTDMAEIRLNMSDIEFNEEDEGPFNVCVIVESEEDDCPVEFDIEFTIRFTRISRSTDDTDNGDNIDHGGDQICRNVILDPCNTTACVDLKDVFNITDDNEYHLQSFNVSLLSNTSRDSEDIGILEVFTEVREFKVLEDDLLLLKLEQSEYYIFDSNKSVEICLKVENGGNEQCQADADFYYRVHTYGGNATHTEDYAPLGEPHNRQGGLMKFDKCGNKSCFYINITDDSTTVEQVEYFNFSLTIENDGNKYAEQLNETGAVFLLPK